MGPAPPITVVPTATSDPAPASRPRLGAEVLSAAERTRRRRAAGRLAAIKVRAELADRFRAVRDARGESAAQTLEAALDALARPQIG